MARVIEKEWPEKVAPGDLANADFWSQSWNARTRLMETLSLA